MKTRKVKFMLDPSVVQEATSVIILGDFNNWEPHEAFYLSKGEDGIHAIELDLLPGQYQYRYFLNDGRWADDNAPKVRSEFYGNEVYNCVVVVEEVKQVKMANDKPDVAKVKKATSRKSETKPKSQTPEVDLKLIPGITKPIEALLKKAGVNTYAKLGKTSVKKLQEVLDNAGEKYAKTNPASWPKAAKFVAVGDTDGLKALAKEASKKK